MFGVAAFNSTPVQAQSGGGASFTLMQLLLDDSEEKTQQQEKDKGLPYGAWFVPIIMSAAILGGVFFSVLLLLFFDRYSSDLHLYKSVYKHANAIC